MGRRLAVFLCFCLGFGAVLGSGPAEAFQAKVKVAGIHGTRVAYYERGRGKPLLMLTGTGSTMGEWDPALLRLLARGHRLLLLDYPGVGLSGPWRGAQTFAGLADDVGRFMGAVGLRRADVLGWSMGGFVAQRLAVQHPGRVSHLVLAGTNPGGSRTVLGSKQAQEIDSEPNPPLRDILGELYPPYRLGEGYRFVHRLEVASRRGEIPDDFHVSTVTTDAQVAAEDPWLRSDRNFHQLGRLSIPVLATAGRKDPVVPPINLRRIANRVPGARFRVFAGAHAFLFQQRRRFVATLRGFLSVEGPADRTAAPPSITPRGL